MAASDLVVIEERFRGPPSSGNGGYVAGLLSRSITGPATCILRAPVPLATPLSLGVAADRVTLTGEGERLIAEARPAVEADLPEPPPAPTLEQARAAGARYIGLQQSVHPICLTCGANLSPQEGLRVFVGHMDDAPPGHVAGVWTPDRAFAAPDGRAAAEIVWAAMDCPGFYAWVDVEGRHGALLGTMHAEVVERPRSGEVVIVRAWPLEKAGRREVAGVALFDAGGRLLARARQVWITIERLPRPEPPV